MPPPESPCSEDDTEATHNDKQTPPKLAPQAPPTTHQGDEAPNGAEGPTMLLMMEGGTRLVSQPGTANPGDRHTFIRDSGLSATASASAAVADPCVEGGVHVASSQPRKNDTADPPTRTRTEQLSSQVDGQESFACSTESDVSTTQSVNPTQPTTTNFLLSEALVEASIKAAVASIREAKLPSPQNLEATNQDAQEEDSTNTEETETMSVGNHLFPKKKAKTPRKRPPQVKPGQATGRWTHEEHQTFLEGLRTCGREWKKVASLIPTRTSAQIRSHAQKYFAKLQREEDSATMRNGQSSASIPTDGGMAHLHPSVQRNVERILSNPAAVEREVGETLQALRERYRELQQRLEDQQRQGRASRSSQGQLVHGDDNTDDGHLMGSPSGDAAARRRKRALDEDVEAHGSRNVASRAGSNDDHSSVSSGVSASWQARDLGNGELIALHVLGGALPRADSSVDTGVVQDSVMDDTADEPALQQDERAETANAQDTVMEGNEDARPSAGPQEPSSDASHKSSVASDKTVEPQD